MTKTTAVGVIAGALSAAVIGFAGPAHADDQGIGFGGHSGYSGHYGYGYGSDSNNPWLNQLYPTVKVPKVDTSVHN